MTVLLPGDLDIVFTKHAATRLRERTSIDPSAARDEIRAAIHARRVEHRAREVFYLSTHDQARIYPVALHLRQGVLVVLTVLAAPLVAVAA